MLRNLADDTLAQAEQSLAAAAVPPKLPDRDNQKGAIEALREFKRFYAGSALPDPHDTTRHELLHGDARDLNTVPSESVHLYLCSPPYWNLKKYEGSADQLGDIADYEEFLGEIRTAWEEAYRVLVPGGRLCIVVGDVCIPRKQGRHFVLPLHADIQVALRSVGFDVLTPILWHKIANGATETEGNGAGFYGKPYQPNAIVKNDIEYIILARKPGGYRSATMEQKALSILSKDEMQQYFRSIWTDVSGASTRNGHPAPYPEKLAARLIKMFSFVGDTVLDPFVGTGSTMAAAMASDRHSIGIDIEPSYLALAKFRLERIAENSVGNTVLSTSKATR